jgi:hypothetical protein
MSDKRIPIFPIDEVTLRIDKSSIFVQRQASRKEPYVVIEDGSIVAESTSCTQALSIAVSRYHQLKDFEALLKGEELPSRIARRRVDEKAKNVSSSPDPT